MSYLNNEKRPLDPRDTEIDLEKGVIYEMGNRKEEMYHWGAAVTDYCDMPVEEYMKPPVFAVAGSVPTPGPDSGSTSGDTSGSTSGDVTTNKELYSGYIRKSVYDANPQSVLTTDTIERTTTNRNAVDINILATKYDDFNPDIDIEDEDEYDAYCAQFDIYIIFITSQDLHDIEEAGPSAFATFEKSTITLNGKTYYAYRKATAAIAEPSTFNYNLKF